MCLLRLIHRIRLLELECELGGYLIQVLVHHRQLLQLATQTVPKKTHNRRVHSDLRQTSLVVDFSYNWEILAFVYFLIVLTNIPCKRSVPLHDRAGHRLVFCSDVIQFLTSCCHASLLVLAFPKSGYREQVFPFSPSHICICVSPSHI